MNQIMVRMLSEQLSDQYIFKKSTIVMLNASIEVAIQKWSLFREAGKESNANVVS